jgi:hypothetical protein
VKRGRRLLAVLAATAALAGCSTVRVAYDNADYFLRWRLGGYLDLRGDEQRGLYRSIDAFLVWHRAQALPRYAALSEEAARRLDDGLSREDLNWGYDALMAQAREGLRAAATQIAPVLDRMSAEQVAYLEKRLAEDDRKLARELRGSEAERRKRRAKRMQEQLEEWVGGLTQGQVERVRLYAERAPLTDEFRSRDRKRLQAELVGMVRRHEAKKRLPEFAAHWQRGREPAHTALNEAWRREFYAMLLDLDRTLTPAQRSRAVANLRRYAQDFAFLASRADPQTRTR